MEKGEFLEIQINLQLFNTFPKKTLLRRLDGRKMPYKPIEGLLMYYIIKCQLILTFL